jgi:hypothetical protein
VRARFDRDSWGIGVNPLHSAQPLWYGLPDLIASKLLTGRAPRIRRALRLRPVGRQAGLRSVRIAGQLEVSPDVDLFQRVIELRKSTKDPGADLALKIVANSGAYGAFVEFVRAQVFEPVPIEVRSGDLCVQVETLRPETPGRYSFPPVGALITASARLVLAMIERSVTDEGGSIAFCDTDSAAIVATEHGGLVPCPGGPHRLPDGPDAVRALSWAQVEEIRHRFDSLKPYDPELVRNDVLELEDVNFASCPDCGGQGCDHCRKGVDRSRRRQLYTFVVSAKRYALFNSECSDSNRPVETWQGSPLLYRKVSEHGLGHILDPRDPVGEADERTKHDAAIPDTTRDEMESVAGGIYAGKLAKHRGWIVDAWDWMVRRDGFGLRDLSLPAWASNVAVSQLRISTPEVLRAFRDYNAGKPYADQVKPFGFLLVCHPNPLMGALVPPVEESDVLLLDDGPDPWPNLRRYVLRRGGLSRGDWSREEIPGDLYRRRGESPDVLAAEMPHECPDARGLWAPEDGDVVMLAALQQAHDAHQRRHARRQQARKRWERDFDPNRFQLVAPLERDATRWLTMPWFDRWSGRPFQVTTQPPDEDDAFTQGIIVRTVADVLYSYRRNPESKSMDPQREVPCLSDSRGLLGRRLVIADGVPVPIGKESNDLDERRAALRHEADATTAYARRCEGCGDLLEASADPRQRFHNDACRMRHNREVGGASRPRRCDGCGEMLEPNADPRQRFHGDACRKRRSRKQSPKTRRRIA